MDPRWTPTAADTERSVAVRLYPVSEDYAVVRDGTAAGAVDLAPYCSRIEQRPDELTLTFAWHHELYGAAEPRAGQLVALDLNGQRLWIGAIESRSEYRLESGTRTMTVTARSRDASPKWRHVRRVTDIYPTLTRLDTILGDITEELGLTDDERQLPSITLAVAQSNVQLGDMPAWEMLETLLLPAGYAPFVDGLGRLRARSRDLAHRAPDITLTPERVQAITGSRSRPPISAVRLRWIDPVMTKVAQAERNLASANITAGYFQPRQRQYVYWSDDRTQRAENTRLVVRQSANSGLLKVCDEDYEELSHTHGRIVLETASWVPGLVGVFLAMKAAALIPDGVSWGHTVPYGRVIKAGIEFGALLVMASMGTGSYEIWGTPYDFVHGRNTTEAYNPAAPEWSEEIEEVTSDLIVDAAHARAVAARELIYRVRSADTYGVSILDDPRIEPGDLLALPDGSRLYVTSYRRNLGRDAPATLELEGFQA